MESTSRSLIIVDDYQRQAIGLSQEEAAQSAHASNHHQQRMNVRKQRSQVRGQPLPPEPDGRRRNSLAASNNPKDANNPGGRGTMLPPIFSGPQKKNSQKVRQLAPLHPNSKKLAQPQ